MHLVEGAPVVLPESLSPSAAGEVHLVVDTSDVVMNNSRKLPIVAGDKPCFALYV